MQYNENASRVPAIQDRICSNRHLCLNKSMFNLVP